MKRLIFNLIIGALAILAVFTSCNKEDDPVLPFKIEGITHENFPFLDGSTTAGPLLYLIAIELLGDDWWNYDGFAEQKLKTSQTHNAFINLIDKNADLIFSARTMSADEKAHAAEANIHLIEMPIALDALIFIVHPDNRVNSLTHKQLQDIYTGKIENWKDVGGNNAPITPYVRNRNSGSQELMEALLLTEPISDDFPEDQVLWSMMPLLSAVQMNVDGLGYTVAYYRTTMHSDFKGIKTIAVNGIYPDNRTIQNWEYPYTSEFYAIIRSDLDKSSMAYKLYELMQTKAGKRVISDSGYVPYW